MTADRPALSHAERIDWLRLIRSEQVGPVTFHRLIERFGSAGAALAALPELARRGGRARPLAIARTGDAERELAALERLGAVLLARPDPAFPPLLRAVEDGPPLITVRGNLPLLMQPMVAVVGARNASLSGRKIAQTLAAGLGVGGMVVASGLARGIDTAAHEGALRSGTVAVLAGGVDHVYPPENARLYEAITAGGAVVSEMPPGTVPQASHFPRRNRLISGMALGVVVVEATARSGSLITARCALDQGREVFAVPGSPLDPRCQGPNDLLRQGATLTETAEDVLRALAGPLRRRLAEPGGDGYAPPPPPGGDPAEATPARSRITALLGPTPVAVDEIIRRCQFSPAVVLMVLLELELAGRLDRHPGNLVSLLH